MEDMLFTASSHALWILVVIIPVLALTGLPKGKTRYRVLMLGLSTLCLLTAIRQYVSYLLGPKYFPDTPHWPILLFAIAMGALALGCAIEIWVMLFFSKEEKKPNQ